MWSDNETSVDLLGYQHLVGALLSIVRRDDLLPATLGAYGDWGSGKSSLLQMARAELEKDEETLVVSFNGWLFEGYEDAKTALMGTIIEELADRKTLTAKGKETLLKLVGRINVMRVAGGMARIAAGYAGGGVPGLLMGAAPDLATVGASLLEKAKDIRPEDLSGFLREQDPAGGFRRGVREFRRDFAELLDDTKLKRLVVFVDDLDRCAPDTIIETLEAIKLFLFVPHTAFVIGADERLVRYAVRRRFPELPGDNAEVGRDYLEKLIQFPIRIPPMGRTETDSYIKLLLVRSCDISDHAYQKMRDAVVGANSRLDAMLDNRVVVDAMTGSTTQEVTDAMALAEQIAPVLAAGLLGNPRQCKRFLNTLMMRVEMGTSRGVELRRRVLAKLMLLEYLRPESFKDLARLQAATRTGAPQDLREAERAVRDSRLAPVTVEPEIAGASRPGSARSKQVDGSASTASHAAVARVASFPSALAAWASDKWLSDWLAADPSLADEDLRPYLYFAREKLDPLAGMALHLSPEAQDVLAKLLGTVEAQRTLALNRAGVLSPADAAAVLEALGNRARETESPTSDSSSPLSLMCSWTEKRPDLFSELIAFLKSVPDAAVPIGAVPRLAQLASGGVDRRDQVVALLKTWGAGGNARLKTAAVQNLQKLTK
jgi:hypothetical protein